MIPTLLTDRLELRAFTMDDVAAVRRIAGDREVAATTLDVPHPYPVAAAESWIETQAQAAAGGDVLPFAITLREGGVLVGSVGLNVTRVHRRAEIGYWIGRPHWGNGYASEAAARVVQYGFEELGLNRIVAATVLKNPPGAAVMEKIGMTHEGTFREHVIRWGRFEDVACYGLLRRTWDELRRRGRAEAGAGSAG